MLFVEVGGLRITALRSTIDDGRSGAVLVREGAYTLVLWKDEHEVRRVDFVLEPGGPFELEF